MIRHFKNMGRKEIGSFIAGWLFMSMLFFAFHMFQAIYDKGAFLEEELSKAVLVSLFTGLGIELVSQYVSQKYIKKPAESE